MADPVLERLSRQTNAFFESIITFYNGQDQVNWINYLKKIKPTEVPAIEAAYQQYTSCYQASQDKDKCLATILKPDQSQRRILLEFLYNGFDHHGGSIRFGGDQ